MKKDRNYYNDLFSEYPDLVTLKQFREMLGGIGDSTVRRLMRSYAVKHLYVDQAYWIPKVWVVDYVLSEHYAIFKKRLKSFV